jgi:hypothetical protein
MKQKSKWIQRDLEDQIQEEYEKQGKFYKKNESKMKTVNINEAVNLLKQGYVRWTKQETETGKSLQSHYGLSFSQCQELIKHPKLKGVKTKVKSLLIVDETDQPTVPVAIKSEPTLEETVESLFK